MVFQTYVRALVPKEAIAGFGLTHFQFTNRGKPVVYHEDHADYIRTLNRFFFRKIRPKRRRCAPPASHAPPSPTTAPPSTASASPRTTTG